MKTLVSAVALVYPTADAMSFRELPGSGSGDLSGLRGEGGFQADFGKDSNGSLEYWFE
jgi:hypothetical protein